MKIVHVVTYENYGAGRAALRICEAQKRVGCEAQVLVLKKNNDSDVYELLDSTKNKIFFKIANYLNYITCKDIVFDGYFHLEKYGLSFEQNSIIRNADIIQLHWLNDGIWSKSFVNTLYKLGKPIVWTMHDMWPFTGGCHYDDYCGKYIKGCELCDRCKKNGVTKEQAKIKKKIFEKLNIQMVGCSRWITDSYNNSFVASGASRKGIVINNPIDFDVFRSMPMDYCRELLNLPKHKKLIAFGAVASTSDKRKGYEYLHKALNYLSKDEYELVLFGCKQSDQFSEFNIHCVGNISDDLHLAMIYNAADCFVAPSIQENLANTVVESLACGTPVVAFNIGGMPDMIKSGENGYLAKAFDEKDFAHGIQICSQDKGNMSSKALDLARNTFSMERIGNIYLTVFNKLLEV